ncbi:hypothetical protein [Bradyrhizobium sp. SSBR45R]|uniref:hypothetical protein n=1 Tax=Bradyrhizobium sp. SSBR45R TaxID=2996007 RepID=UPI0024E185DA|nr:hypothetical protein [Bradyrhizobium sp. SSBR45R]
MSSIGAWLTGCASFEVIHDPRFGAVSKEHLPTLIKSVKCELQTFYTANNALRDELRAERIERAKHGETTIPLSRIYDLRHFDLDDEAYGAFSLDIKVQDSFALPGTPSSFVNVLSPTTGHTKTLGIGPSVQAQGTYDNVLWFSVPQNASVAVKPYVSDAQARAVAFRQPPVSTEEDNLCYRRVVPDHYYQALAAGEYPGLELFDRIKVNGVQPLAAWLQENGDTMGISRNVLLDAHAEAEKRKPIPVEPPYGSQAIDGGQLSYIFTVQYTGGLDVKFSLVSSRWNPALSDVSGGIQQTGTLSIYVNGYQAAAAIGAKSALTAIAPKSEPMKVIIVEGNAKSKTGNEATKNAVKNQLEKALPESTTAGTANNMKLNEFLGEFSKDQTDPTQKAQTLSKLRELNLPLKTEKNVAGTVNELSKPSTRVITVPAGPPTTNNGRGVFRYPPSFPSP